VVRRFVVLFALLLSCLDMAQSGLTYGAGDSRYTSLSSPADVLRSSPAPKGTTWLWYDPNTTISADPHYKTNHVLCQFGPGLYQDFWFRDGLGNGVQWCTGQGVAKIAKLQNQSTATKSGTWTSYTTSGLFVRGGAVSAGGSIAGGTATYSTSSSATLTFTSYGTDFAIDGVCRSGGGFAIVTVDGNPAPGLPVVTSAMVSSGWFSSGQIGSSFIELYDPGFANGSNQYYLGNFGTTGANHTIVIAPTGTNESGSSSSQVTINGIYCSYPGLQPGPNAYPMYIGVENDWWSDGSAIVSAINCTPSGGTWTFLSNVHGYQAPISNTVLIDGSAYTPVAGQWQPCQEFDWANVEALVHPSLTSTTTTSTVTASTSVPIGNCALFPLQPDGTYPYLVVESGTGNTATRTAYAVTATSATSGAGTLTISSSATIANGATIRASVCKLTTKLSFRSDRTSVMQATVSPLWQQAMQTGEDYAGMLALGVSSTLPPTNQHILMATYFDQVATGNTGWLTATLAQSPPYNSADTLYYGGASTWGAAYSSKSWLAGVFIGIAIPSVQDNLYNLQYNVNGPRWSFRADGSFKWYPEPANQSYPVSVNIGDSTARSFAYCAVYNPTAQKVLNTLVNAHAQ